MSLSPSKETVWSQHQEYLKNIREKINGDRRAKSNSPAYHGSRQLQPRQAHRTGTRANSRRTTSSTPPYLPRLDTPPEHDRHRLNNNLRGNQYNIVPPVQPKEAFVDTAEEDSWGEESDSEGSAYTPQVLPFAVPVYPAHPAVVYPGMPGQPYVFYPPVTEGRKTKQSHKQRNQNGKPGKKKSVRFDTIERTRKPLDSHRMKYSQFHPAYRSLYNSLATDIPEALPTDHQPPQPFSGFDPFDENKNPILQKYKYIYPSKSAQRSALTDLDRNSQIFVLDDSYLELSHEVCEQLISAEVEVIMRELIRETTNELVDDYLGVKLTSHDPLEDFLTQLMNDGVEAAVQVVVKETLQDLTDDALIFSASCDIIDDLLCDELKHVAPDLLEQVTFDLLLEEFIEEEVIRSEVNDESKVIANEVLIEVDSKIRRRELKEVSKYAQEKLCDSVCLDYLLALISRQGTIWTQSDFANRAMDSMMLSLLMEQYFHVQTDRAKTLDNVALCRLHEKAVTGVALDVFLGQLSAALDEDMADVDEYEWGISLPVPSKPPLGEQLFPIPSSNQKGNMY